MDYHYQEVGQIDYHFVVDHKDYYFVVGHMDYHFVMDYYFMVDHMEGIKWCKNLLFISFAFNYFRSYKNNILIIYK